MFKIGLKCRIIQIKNWWISEAFTLSYPGHVHVFEGQETGQEVWGGAGEWRPQEGKDEAPKQLSRPLIRKPWVRQTKGMRQTENTRSWHPGKQAWGRRRSVFYVFIYNQRIYPRRSSWRSYFLNSRSWTICGSQNQFSGYSLAFFNEIEKY